jgi:2-succinyl-5-enolpyruvyl-6-hydroxy-3-cyclohexene-1-carboxylate synthase
VIVDAVPDAGEGIPDPAWAARWTTADDVAAGVVTETLDVESLSGPAVARIVAQHAGAEDLLVIGPSWPGRHVSSYAG